MEREQRDELLIRLDERTHAIQQWTIRHEGKHHEEKAAKLRWNLATLSFIGGILTKMIFWK